MAPLGQNKLAMAMGGEKCETWDDPVGPLCEILNTPLDHFASSDGNNPSVVNQMSLSSRLFFCEYLMVSNFVMHGILFHLNWES